MVTGVLVVLPDPDERRRRGFSLDTDDQVGADWPVAILSVTGEGS